MRGAMLESDQAIRQCDSSCPHPLCLVFRLMALQMCHILPKDRLGPHVQAGYALGDVVKLVTVGLELLSQRIEDE